MARTPISAARTAAAQQENTAQNFIVPRLELPPLSTAGRTLRRPRHDFQVRTRPWHIQPVAIAPVLAGETLVSASIQARVVTDPIKNPLVGWHQEYMMFYVKHRDMDAYAGNNEYANMHVAGGVLTTLVSATAIVENYKQSSVWSVKNVVGSVMGPIIKYYFRDDDEPVTGWAHAGTNAGIDGNNFLARVRDLQWMDSLKIEDVNPTMESDLPGIVTQLPSHMAAFSAHYDQWAFMRESKLTEATFDDYLAAHGIKAPAGAQEEEFKPELLRYVKDWQYPSNTINPENGAPASAVSWAIRERIDKARFFKEPGFIVVVSITRPKVYWGNQKNTASGMLDDPFAWLPALMRDDPFTSLVEYDHNEGPLEGVMNAADDHWIDRRDLFLYGDQFVNFSHSADRTASIVALPASSGDNIINNLYATSADRLGLFVDDDDSEGKTRVRQDGVVQLNINSHQKDST